MADTTGARPGVRSNIRRTLVLALLACPLAVGSLTLAPAALADSGSSGHGSSGSGSFGSGSSGDAPGTLLGQVPETLDTDWGDDDTDEGEHAAALSGSWDAKKDLGSLYSLTDTVGAQHVWKHDRATGAGVTVAVIDTGVTPVPGLDQGQVVNGPDLSYESQRSGTRYLDGFGHGTHMAGIIAGRDPGFRADKPDSDAFAGVAPEAQILNMKVATADGGADVSQVIAAIDWVVQHRDDNGMNVRVISLAYGTTSTQPASVDPLAHAVENAWRSGIVVVAAAGNDGNAAPLLMPATDPYVIAVGAVDHLGTKSSNDDTVADFSNGGSASRRPDLLAPGKSVVSLRVPGSYIDDMHPEGLLETEPAHRFFRGSGTSQATAVVAGAVALLLDDRPYLTPDQVKSLLRTSADRLSRPQPAMGAGVVDVDGAARTSVLTTLLARQTWPRSTGLGSLEATRGGEHVFDPTTGTELSGETDALGDPWQPVDWAEASTAGRAWTGGAWGGRTWTGTSWTLAGWAAVDWAGPSWSGIAWEDHTWSEAYWAARSWRDDSWLARSWRYGTWEARSWRADSWEARSWRTESFLARSWRSTP